MLAAPVQLGAPVSAEPVGTVLEILKGMFDVVVVDTSGAFDDFALQALDHSDLLVLVGTLDIPSLKSLKLGDRDAGPAEHPARPVAAGAQPGGPQGRPVRRGVRGDAGRRPSPRRLPSSRDVLTAVNRGEPIVRGATARHQVSKALASFAAVDRATPRPAPPPPDRVPRRDAADARASARGR